MKVHEFTIVPLELGDSSKQIREGVEKQTDKFESTDFAELENTFEWSANLSDTQTLSDQYSNSTLFVCFIDSSLCFVLYGVTDYAERDLSLIQVDNFQADNIASDIKDRRKLLEKGTKDFNSSHFQLVDTYNSLALDKKGDEWKQATPDYAFSFYVLEREELTNEQAEEVVHAIAFSRSSHSEVQASGALSKEVLSAAKTDPQPKYLDYYTNIWGLSTWSSFVLVAPENELDEAIRLALNSEVQLQAVWNRCHFLAKRAMSLLDKSNSESKLQTSLGDIINFKKVVLGAIRLSKQALTSTVSSRQRNVNDYLVETSRVEDEVQSLSQVVELLSSEVEVLTNENREAQEVKRQRGQAWITVMLALFAGVGVTESLADDWGRPWLHAGVGLFVGLVATFFSIIKPRQTS